MTTFTSKLHKTTLYTTVKNQKKMGKGYKQAIHQNECKWHKNNALNRDIGKSCKSNLQIDTKMSKC